MEGPADECIGGAEQARYFDFGAARHHLQADGVEGDGDEADAEQQRQQCDGGTADLEQRRQSARPVGIELHQRDLGQFAKFGGQFLHRLGPIVLGLHGDRVGEGVARQGVDHVGQSFARLHARQRFLARNELECLDARMLLQLRLQFLSGALAGVEIEEHRDLRRWRRIARELHHVGDQHLAAGRQRQRNTDGEQRQQRVQRRSDEALDRCAEGIAVLRKPDAHCSLLIAASRGRAPAGARPGTGWHRRWRSAR